MRAGQVKRALILVHRYVGIVVSLLMVAWCLSGFVMMYVGFPQLEEQERVAGLAPLDLQDCCNDPLVLDQLGEAAVAAFSVEMLAGQPVLKVRNGFDGLILSLKTGSLVEHLEADNALAVAADYQRGHAINGNPVLLARVDQDQWTVSGEYDGDRPLYHIAFGDPAGTHVYVSSRSGEVVLDTNARERIWNWFGAVTHWLYPIVLRQHGAAWSQVVIWTSLVGTFLTLTGLWLGLMQVRAGRSRKFSPYAGWNLWHHVSGLVFGLLLLTWVGSGLLSMNPWGLLEFSGGRAEGDRLRGVGFTGNEVMSTIRRVAAGSHEGVVRLASAPFMGRLHVVLQEKDAVARFDAGTLDLAPLAEADLRAAAEVLQPGVVVASREMLQQGDAYYYDDHAGRRSFPVYRVVLADSERTRYYIDPVDGQLLQKTDRNGRWYRWLFQALHRWDFAAPLHRRPLWDIVVWMLLLGVTAVSLTGLYLGFRRIRPR